MIFKVSMKDNSCGFEKLFASAVQIEIASLSYPNPLPFLESTLQAILTVFSNIFQLARRLLCTDVSQTRAGR
jgi:hypothetical protein